MGRSGYTSLSVEEKRYARLRRAWETKIDTDKTFTAWCTDVLDKAVEREDQVNKRFPGIRFVGVKSGGCILEEKGNIIEISVSNNVGKSSLTCSQDKGVCKHVLFAVLHPDFVL